MNRNSLQIFLEDSGGHHVSLRGVVAFVLGVGLAFHYYPLDIIPGDLGDARFNMFVLEHGYQWLTGPQAEFWKGGFFFPSPENAIAFSDHHIGNLPIYSLFRGTGCDRETAFQAWILVTAALNFWVCYAVLRRLGFLWLPSMAGAVLFAYGLPATATAVHIQMHARYPIPLALLGLHLVVVDKSRVALILLALSMLWQLYIGFYLGYFLALLLFGALVGYCVALRVSPWRLTRNSIWDDGRWKLSAGLLLAFVLLSLPFALPYLEVAHDHGTRDWGEVSGMLPRLASYFQVYGSSMVWGWLQTPGAGLVNEHEHRMFAGLLPLLAVCMTAVIRFCWPEDSKQQLVAAAMAISLFAVGLLTLAVGGKSLYVAVWTLPGCGAVRAVTRIACVLLFPAGVCLAYLFTVLLERVSTFGRKRAWMFALVGFVACFLEQWCYSVPWTVSKSLCQERVATMKASILEAAGGNLSGEVVVVKYFEGGEDFMEKVSGVLDMLLAAQSLGIETMNGYSGGEPDGIKIFPSKTDVARIYQTWPEAFSGKRLVMLPRPISSAEITRKQKRLLRALQPKEMAYRLELLSSRESPDGALLLEFQLENRSPTDWPAKGEEGNRYRIQISYRMLDTEGRAMGEFSPRIGLPRDLATGESLVFEVRCEAGHLRGASFCEVSLVQELVAWFHDKGYGPVRFEIH